jgi:hypothetical protein
MPHPRPARGRLHRHVGCGARENYRSDLPSIPAAGVLPGPDPRDPLFAPYAQLHMRSAH